MVVELTVIIHISINPVNVSGIYWDSPVGIIAASMKTNIIIDRLSYEMETKATRNGEIYQPAVLPSIYGNN